MQQFFKIPVCRLLRMVIDCCRTSTVKSCKYKSIHQMMPKTMPPSIEYARSQSPFLLISMPLDNLSLALSFFFSCCCYIFFFLFWFFPAVRESIHHWEKGGGERIQRKKMKKRERRIQIELDQIYSSLWPDFFLQIGRPTNDHDTQQQQDVFTFDADFKCFFFLNK